MFDLQLGLRFHAEIDAIPVHRQESVASKRIMLNGRLVKEIVFDKAVIIHEENQAVLPKPSAQRCLRSSALGSHFLWFETSEVQLSIWVNIRLVTDTPRRRPY